MPESNEGQEAPGDLRPSTIGHWAVGRPAATNEDLARISGIARGRVADCRRLAQTLNAEILWLIDTGTLSVRQGLALCRLEQAVERTTMAALLVHEAQVSKKPVSAERTAALIRARQERPGEPIEDFMARNGGLQFDERPKFLTVPDDVASMYAASWRWRDQSLAEYMTKAPERLAHLTKAMEEITVSGDIPINAHKQVRVTAQIRINPGETWSAEPNDKAEE